MQSPTEHNPWEYAGCLSKIFFCWIFPLFRQGYKNYIKTEDLYQVPRSDGSEALAKKLQSNWDEELRLYEEGKKEEPRLYCAIIKTFWRELILWVLAAFTQGFCSILQCFFLQRLIWYFTPNSGITTQYAYLYAAGLTLCVAGVVLLTHPEAFGLAHIGMRIRVACCSLIYKKALKLNHLAMQDTNSGQVINLLANDVYRFDTVLAFINCLWTGPLMIVVVFVLVFRELGIYALAALVLTLVMIPVQIGIGRCESYIRNHTVEHTDDRVKCLSEVITGMRDIKMHTWESPFTSKVRTLRSREVHRLAQSSTLQAIVFFLYCSWGLLSGFCTFLPYVLTGHVLQAYQVFYSLALYDILREYTFYDYPTALQYTFETKVSLRRIKKFLMLDEWKRLEHNADLAEHKPGTIIVKNLHASWTKSMDNPVLHDINFEAKPGELIAVIGPVGCGKSSLLRALMNDLTQVRDELVVEGSLSHSSQQPWVFKDTLKRNVIFWDEFDEEKYNKVIEVCNLVPDVSRLTDGHNTLVGEKGEGLSGGQRARVNLARAVYRDADIYLLEDPFSALDYKVARHIMDKCICGHLAGKTRILVTHQTQYLDAVDKVLVLKEGGILGFGTLKEIEESGIDCADVIRQAQEDKEKRMQAKKRWNRLYFTVKTTGAFKQNVAPPPTPKKLMRARTATSVFGKGHFMKLPSSYQSQGSYLSEEYLKEVKARKAGRTDAEVDGSAEEETEEEEEESEEGQVGYRVYFRYFRAGFGILGFIFVMLISLSTQALYVATDWVLSSWVDSNEVYLETNDANETLFFNDTMDMGEVRPIYNASGNGVNISLELQVPKVGAVAEENKNFLFLYTSLVAASLLFGLIRSISLFLGAVNASRNLHSQMFDAIMHTYISFFDSNATGRILNRFSKDVGIMDDLLPFSLVDFMQHSLILIGILCVVIVVNQWVLVVTVPLIIIFIILRRFYLKTSNSVKRLEGTTRSPVFSLLTSSIQGLWTIRPPKKEQQMEHLFFQRQDKHSSAWFLFLATIRWFAICLDWLVVVFVAAVAFGCVLAAESLDAGFVGLSLTYSLNLIGVFQWCVRASADVESHMISVERIRQYSELEPETDGSRTPREEWPSEGAISFNDVSYSYNLDSPPKLKRVNFSIRPREKIGIVGRSGAGKSTIIEALLRMSEPEGTITIDGESTDDVKLCVLRNKIAVIPQVPMLFSGTLRMNLDPFDEFDDERLWKVIDQVDLREMVEAMEERFDGELCEGGSNLSVGQRQLVCLARAILQETKILVIDEATANIDATTDERIQKTIKKQFKDCTVLTIAHRLNTVIDCDKIMVVHDGTIAEFDEPYKLMQKEEGAFRNMVTASKGIKSKIEMMAKLKKQENRKSKGVRYRRMSDATFNREPNGDLNVRSKCRDDEEKAPLASDTEL
ncbi:ATP-binding cassette sub-family C member 4-like [Ptychodera flava]|uniref:ATP-binding cassette sub-family C member 4-like n=1 Tax=Ptychodera flava TaxID=63121 RepID=UPI003969D903